MMKGAVVTSMMNRSSSLGVSFALFCGLKKKRPFTKMENMRAITFEDMIGESPSSSSRRYAIEMTIVVEGIIAS